MGGSLTMPLPPYCMPPNRVGSSLINLECSHRLTGKCVSNSTHGIGQPTPSFVQFDLPQALPVHFLVVMDLSFLTTTKTAATRYLVPCSCSNLLTLDTR